MLTRRISSLSSIILINHAKFTVFMDILTESYQGLYQKEPDRELRIKYSGQFSGYNANVRYTSRYLEFRLARQWKPISSEIRIGLIQSLMQKVYKTRHKTINIDLYNNFLRNVHIAIPKTESDPVLERSFERVNERYFSGLIEIPNLRWGQKSRAKLGSYDYGTDTITMSTIFKAAPSNLLDYIMYHELLHKKHKFKSSGKKSYHHTKQFKQDEKLFENHEQTEKDLKSYIRSSRKTAVPSKDFNILRLIGIR